MTRELPEAARDAVIRLTWEYEHERAHRSETFPSTTDPKTCRYCGKTRQIYAGCRLDGHGGCIVGDEYKLRVYAAINEHRLAYHVVATALGLTLPIVRRWWLWAWERSKAAATS